MLPITELDAEADNKKRENDNISIAMTIPTTASTDFTKRQDGERYTVM